MTNVLATLFIGFIGLGFSLLCGWLMCAAIEYFKKQKYFWFGTYVAITILQLAWAIKIMMF